MSKPDDTPTLAWSMQDLRDQLNADMADNPVLAGSERLTELMETELGR